MQDDVSGRKARRAFLSELAFRTIVRATSKTRSDDVPTTSTDLDQSVNVHIVLYYYIIGRGPYRISNQRVNKEGTRRFKMEGSTETGPLIGVLALQGAFAEHQQCLEAVGCRTVQVRYDIRYTMRHKCR
jgi:hypothetical protein